MVDVYVVLVRDHETNDIRSCKELEAEAVIRGVGLWLCQKGAEAYGPVKESVLIVA